MIFSPAGWDNEKKISILYENLNTMKADDCYEDVITKPITRKVLIYKHKKNYSVFRFNLQNANKY